MNHSVLGFFPYADRLLGAAARLKQAGYRNITIFSPIPIVHEVDHVLGEKKNPIKFFTFFGSLTGFFFGTTLAFGTAALYILPRFGKPVWSVTPTVVIAYETTILLGVFATLISFLLFARLPYYKKRVYDIKIGVDRFGLLVRAEEEKLRYVEEVLKEAGAEEVKRIYED